MMERSDILFACDGYVMAYIKPESPGFLFSVASI